MAKAVIKIDAKLCKGCAVCVELCPTGALVMKDFKAAIKDAELCTGCTSCELRCPDFAIEITRI